MNTGVGCHFLLQGILLIQGSNLCLLCLLHWQVDSVSLAPPGNHPWCYTQLKPSYTRSSPYLGLRKCLRFFLHWVRMWVVLKRAVGHILALNLVGELLKVQSRQAAAQKGYQTRRCCLGKIKNLWNGPVVINIRGMPVCWCQEMNSKSENVLEEIWE